MPQPRSQLVTVRRPRAKSSPVQSCTNRACWRASSVPAKAVIQTTSDTGSHCDSIHGSPSHDSVAISNHSMRGEPPHLKSPPASGTPNEVPDFWESADCQQVAEKALKAYLVFWDQRVVKIHDIGLLLDQVMTIEPVFETWRDAADRLTPLATLYRYPGLSDDPLPSEFEEALDDATTI